MYSKQDFLDILYVGNSLLRVYLYTEYELRQFYHFHKLGNNTIAGKG